MARDPLPALLRVRRLALDEARRSLAASLRDEAAAARALAQMETEIVLERATAACPEVGDAAVEAFAGWLRIARARAGQAAALHARMTGETARVRAIVAIARGSFEAAENALARRAEDQRHARERHEQHGLDEAAQRRHRRMRSLRQ